MIDHDEPLPPDDEHWLNHFNTNQFGNSFLGISIGISAILIATATVIAAFALLVHG